MKPGSFIAALCVLALVPGCLSGLSFAQGEPRVLLSSGLEPIELAGHISELYDPTGKLTFDDVRKGEIAGQFELSDRTVFTHGLSSDTYWYRWSLQVPAEQPGVSRWVLTLGIPTLDFLDVHVQRGNGDIETFLAGDLRPNNPRLIPYGGFAIPFDTQAAENLTIHVRLQTTGRHQFWPILWEERGFVATASTENRARGFFNGVLAVMILYNLLIFISIRERTYLYYVLFLVVFQSVGFILSGTARLVGNDLFAGAPAIINAMAAYSPPVSASLLLLFSGEFMQTRIHAPRIHRVLLVLAMGTVLPALLFPIVGFLLSVKLSITAFLLALPFLMWVGIFLSLKGVRAARFYLLAWSSLLVVMALFLVESVGWQSIGWETVWGPPIAVSIAVALLSLALADRLNSERRERERLTRLKNFFAPQVAEVILEEGGTGLLAPKRREVTVVFTDLRGFTALAAQSEPEDVIRVLREYHEAVVETAAEYGGNVEHIAGDGVMIYFNAPIEVSEPEARAARMAFELRDKFEVLREHWRKRGHEVGVGIGMACGFATVGAVGAKGRMDYSCIGTVTNVAARLCAQSSHGQILAPQLFVNRVEALVTTESIGEHELKGISKPVSVHNLSLLIPAAAGVL